MLIKIFQFIIALPKPIALTVTAVPVIAVGAGGVAVTQYVNEQAAPQSQTQVAEENTSSSRSDDSAKVSMNKSSTTETKKADTAQKPKTDTKTPAATKPSGSSSSSSTSKPSSPTPTPQPAASCPNGTHTPGGSDGAGGCWPYAGNTGVPAGTSLTAYTGPCSIQSNTVIQDKTVNCALQIYNDASLTIRRSVVNGFIENTYTSGAGKLLVEDSEVHAGAWSEGAVWGSSLTVSRSEVTGGQHSVHCENNCTVNDSWLHNQYNPDGGSYHNNAFISNGGTNMTLRHNTLHCTALLNATDGGCTGDLTLLGDFDTISYVNAESNLLMANNSSISFCTYGGYTPGKPYPNGHHITYHNNVFQRGANGKCGVYGAVTSYNPAASGNIWSGNIWSDGSAVSP